MMQILRKIFLTFWFITAWSLIVGAQDSQWTVCASDTGIAYFVTGWETSTFNWSVEGGTISRDCGDTIFVDWPHVPGSYTISVQEISVNGCLGELKRGMVEVVGLVIDLGADTYICEGEEFVITPEGVFTSYLWSDGSTGSSYSTAQQGWISLAVTDSHGCTLSDSIYLTVNNLPAVDLGTDTTLCGNQTLILDGGSDGSLFNWSTGDISQTLTVYNDGEQQIWVIIEDALGCINGDTIFIDKCQIESPFMDMPTAITPNGDGVNDVWEIDKLASFNRAVVDIYNQWGNLIWRSEPGYPSPWDGRDMKGRLVPVDSYHFVIEFNNGSDEYFIGIVTVIR